MSGNKLEQLPDYIKDVLHALIKSGRGAHSVKKLLEEKFGEFQDILPANRNTYRSYIQLHKHEIDAEQKNSANILQSMSEDLDRIVDFSEGLAGGRSAKEELQSLKDFMVDRIESLQKLQLVGIPSPQLESCLVQYSRVLSALVEKSFEYREELDRDQKDLNKKFFITLIRKMFSQLIRIHRKYHGEVKLQEFMLEVADEYFNLLKENFEFDSDAKNPVKLEDKSFEPEPPQTTSQ